MDAPVDGAAPAPRPGLLHVTTVAHLQQQLLQLRLVADQAPVHLVGLLQEGVDAGHGLLPVLLRLYRVHGAAGPGRQAVLELGVLAEAAAVAEEGVLLVVVDGPALVALEDVLPTVAADAGVGGDGGAAAGALQGLAHRLHVLVEVAVLDHDVAGHDGERELDLELGLAGGEGDPLGQVPHRRTVLQLHHRRHRPVVVVHVDSPDHLLALEVADPEEDLGDGVAAGQLDHLGAGAVLGVHLQAAQLQVGEAHLGRKGMSWEKRVKGIRIIRNPDQKESQ